MPSSRTVSRRRPTLLPRPLPAERSQCTPARNTWRRPWRRCGVWGAVSPPGSRASPLPLQNIYRGPAASLRCRIPAFPPICKPSLWRWPPRQRATPPLPKRSFPGAGPCGGTAPLGADITVVGSHAVIRGAPLIGSALTCTDLRAGAAVVLAALAAKGESSVTAISHIERGYADFVSTLRHLGADIYLTEV